MLTSKQRRSICYLEAWKRLAGCVTINCWILHNLPFSGRFELISSRLNDNKAWLRMAGSSLRNGQKAPKPFICWSNAEIFHVCITPKNLLTSETDTGSAHALGSENQLTAAVLLPTSPSFFLSHDWADLLPLSPFPFPSLNAGRQRQDKRRQAERWHGSPEHENHPHPPPFLMALCTGYRKQMMEGADEKLVTWV